VKLQCLTCCEFYPVWKFQPLTVTLRTADEAARVMANAKRVRYSIVDSHQLDALAICESFVIVYDDPEVILIDRCSSSDWFQSTERTTPVRNCS